MHLDHRPDDAANLARSGRVYKLEEMFRELEQFKGQDLPHFVIEPQTSWFDPDVPNLPANAYKWAFDNIEKSCRLSAFYRNTNAPWPMEYWHISLDIDVMRDKITGKQRKRVVVRGTRPSHTTSDSFMIDIDLITLTIRGAVAASIVRWKRGWIDGALRWVKARGDNSAHLQVSDLGICPEYLNRIEYEVYSAKRDGALLLSSLMRYSTKKNLEFPVMAIEKPAFQFKLNPDGGENRNQEGNFYIRNQVKTPEEIVMAFGEFSDALMDEVCMLGSLVSLDGEERMERYLKKAEELINKLRIEVQAYISANHAEVVDWYSYDSEYEEHDTV